MREGLAREFPEAVRAAAWTRGRLGAWSEPPAWATISAIGAGLLGSALAQAAVGLTGEAFLALQSSPPLPLFPLVTIAGSAAAAAVALGVGGPVVLGLYLAYVALGVALRIPGLLTFCERAGGVFPGPGNDLCTVMGFLATLWPQFVGIGLGIALARAIATRGSGINATLRIAGGYALAQLVMAQVWASTVARTENAVSSGVTVAAFAVAAAVAAGVIAAQLPRGIRSAAVVAGISLLPWLTLQLPNALRTAAAALSPEHVGPMLVGIAIQPMAAAFLVLTAAVAARGRFVPRDTA
ncbi:MAG: hypothetical protein WEE03_06375 [Chloroflexota bacterium]